MDVQLAMAKSASHWHTNDLPRPVVGPTQFLSVRTAAGDSLVAELMAMPACTIFRRIRTRCRTNGLPTAMLCFVAGRQDGRAHEVTLCRPRLLQLDVDAGR